MPEQPVIVSADGVTLEVSAPAEGILRIRVGFGALPPGESWAVPKPRRGGAIPLLVLDTPDSVVLRTETMEAVIARRDLRLRLSGADGAPMLDDATGRHLEFAGGGFALRKTMPADTHYFGLGDKAGPLDRRGGAYVLWNTDSPFYGAATDPLYKAIPFFLGVTEDGCAHGVFLDNHWRTSFDFGRGERDVLCIRAEGGPLDYYVLAGPDAKSVLRRYDWLTGPAPLMPRWALGFQQSRWSYTTQAEVEAIAGRLRDGAIPADAIYLDIDYQDRNRPFTVDGARFPDLGGLASRLRGQGLRLVLITDMHIPHAPDAGYAPYDSGTAEDAWVTDPDGAAFVGEVWPGPSVFPDFSRARVRAWWGGLYAAFVQLGASGFWNDMNEPSVFQAPSGTMPLTSVHRIEEPDFLPRKATHAEMHNVYGLLNSRATYEGLLVHAPDRRPFVLTRASAAGGQRYAATWTGDNVSSWDHLRLSTAMVASLGLSGFAWSGADIGGFGGPRPSADLLTRWTQIGAFHPLFRYHCMTGKPAQEVWADGPEHEAIRRRFIEERYRLLPYLYTLAEENSRTGLPILRPVFLEFPAVLKAPLDAGDFMLGDALLVAPSPVPESPGDYEIRLPGPGWYDYWTGERLDSMSVTITPAIERLPIFVRPGAIVPRQDVMQSTAEPVAGSLYLDVYLDGREAHGTIYTDDGESFGYRNGAYLRRAISCVAHGRGLRLSFGARDGSYPPWWRAVQVTVHGWTGEAVVRDAAGEAISSSVLACPRFTWMEREEADAVTIGPA